MLLLADEAHFQSDDPAPLLAAGVVGVIAKATQGGSYTDPSFLTKVPRFKAAGLHVGAYHFATPGTWPASIEANHFCDVAQHAGCDLIPFLDLEQTALPADATAEWALEWLDVVRQRWTRPGVYCGHGFTDTHLTPLVGLSAFPLWVAHYTSAGSPDPLPRPWTSWVMWQYADGPGFDHDRAPDLAPLLIAAPTPPPVPRPTKRRSSMIYYAPSGLDYLHDGAAWVLVSRATADATVAAGAVAVHPTADEWERIGTRLNKAHGDPSPLEPV